MPKLTHITSAVHGTTTLTGVQTLTYSTAGVIKRSLSDGATKHTRAKIALTDATGALVFDDLTGAHTAGAIAVAGSLVVSGLDETGAAKTLTFAAALMQGVSGSVPAKEAGGMTTFTVGFEADSVTPG